MQPWCNFNDADTQQTQDLIPNGTLVKVRMMIKPGGYNDDYRGFTGGYATKSPHTGTLYLSTEYIIMEGPYAKRRIWGNIGLHSEKSDIYGKKGRTFIKAVLESAHNLNPQDQSEKAQKLRCIADFGTLNGLNFAAKVSVRNDQQDQPKNELSLVLTPDHKDYVTVMGRPAPPLPASVHVLNWGQ